MAIEQSPPALLLCRSQYVLRILKFLCDSSIQTHLPSCFCCPRLILRIFIVTSALNMFVTLLASHMSKLLSIKEFIVASYNSFSLKKGRWGRIPNLGTQGLNQIFADEPFPMCHLLPRISISFTSQIPFHAKDGLNPNLVSKNMTLREVLYLVKFVQQAIFVLENTPPLSCKQSKIKTPWNFEAHSFSQLSQWIFCSFAHWLHQNQVIILFNSKHRPLGSLKQLIAYVGIDKATTLKIISFPPWAKIFSFQTWSLWQTISLISKKSLSFCSTNHGQEVKILLTLNQWLINPQSHQSLLVSWRNILTKDHCGLIWVYVLSWCPLINF